MGVKRGKCKRTIGHAQHMYFDDMYMEIRVCKGIDFKKWNGDMVVVNDRAAMIDKMGGEGQDMFPRWAWPGGYEMFFIMDDGGALCVPCANDRSNPVHFKDEDDSEDGWLIMDVATVETVEAQMNCDHCNRPLWQDDEPTESNGRG